VSLRLRFALFVTVLLGLVLGFAGFALVGLETERAKEEVARRLRHRIHEAFVPLVDEMVEAFGPRLEAPGPPVERPMPPEPDDARLEVVYVARGPGPERVLARTHAGAALLGADGPLPDETRALPPDRLETRTVRGVDVVILSGPAGDVREPAGRRPPRAPPPPEGGPGPPPGGGPDRFRPPVPVVGVAFLEADAAFAPLRARVRGHALVGLSALLLGALAAWALAGRMLKPLRVTAEAAEAIRSPVERLPAPRSGDELGRLTGVLNEMLQRLEAVTEREREFLGKASHEIRRPLAALRGELELALRAERPAADLRTSIGLALGDAKAMGRLVDELLLHARARAGALRLDRRPLDLGEVVQASAARSRRLLPASASIEVRELPPLPMEGDGELLAQVFENLLVNAGTHGGDDVAVEVRGSIDARAVTVVVEDTGVGIPAEWLPRVFEPFGSGDRRRGLSGAGLGLTVARDVVAAHRGEIRVASPVQDGRGTRFTVTLPREGSV
jgi:signal transduction histidine kinase